MHETVDTESGRPPCLFPLKIENNKGTFPWKMLSTQNPKTQNPSRRIVRERESQRPSEETLMDGVWLLSQRRFGKVLAASDTCFFQGIFFL